MGRVKLEEDKKKIKINVTVESSHLSFLKDFGPTTSEAFRKIIDEKIRNDLKQKKSREKQR